MKRAEFFTYIKAQYGTEPDYPWNDNNAVLRHSENRKWYGLVMEVEKEKLEASGAKSVGDILDRDTRVNVLNVKCDPVLAGSLRMQPGIYPAYHMNKEKWISICLDGSVTDQQIKDLVALSYELTGAGKKSRQDKAKAEKDNIDKDNADKTGK